MIHDDDAVSDQIECLLQPVTPLPGENGLRQDLLGRTCGYLRRRRWRNRLVFAVALAACYVAGLFTMSWWSSYAGTTDPEIVRKNTGTTDRRDDDNNTQKKRPTTEKIKPGKDPANSDKTALTALDLEWQALDSLDRRAELYRKAGDLYLTESNDVQSALRCYRGALAAGNKKNWTIEPKDNWLFIVAKKERLKEKDDAENGG